MSLENMRAIEANANFNNMLASGQLGKSGGGPADSAEKVVENAGSDTVKAVAGVLQALGIPANWISSVLGTGVVKEHAGWASKKMNEGGQSFSPGANSKPAAILEMMGLATGKIDFSKIVGPEVSAPAVEVLAMLDSSVHQGQHMSYGEHFHIVPMDTPGMGRGGLSIS